MTGRATLPKGSSMPFSRMHAPFWDSPDRFDPIFERFLQSLEPRWKG